MGCSMTEVRQETHRIINTTGRFNPPSRNHHEHKAFFPGIEARYHRLVNTTSSTNSLINTKTQSYSLLPKRKRRERVNERARERARNNVPPLLRFLFIQINYNCRLF